MLTATLTGLLPVLIFLVALVAVDNFRLVKKSTLLFCFFWGILSALACFFINTYLSHFFSADAYTNFISPMIEELIKSLIIIILVLKGRIGFRIDGAIYGFACGAGFAFLENLYFLDALHDTSAWIWIIRGFGTAIMHGGTVSILSVIVLNAFERKKSLSLYYFGGLLFAYVIHSLYNQFVLPPFTSMVFILLALSISEYATFRLCDKSLNTWLDMEFDSEVRLLMMIRKGQFTQSRYGEYVLSIKDKFNEMVVFDILAYISLYLELSIKAKSNLLLKEAGIPVEHESGIKEQLTELRSLEKNIGKAALLLLSPILRTSKKDLWKWTML